MLLKVGYASFIVAQWGRANHAHLIPQFPYFRTAPSGWKVSLDPESVTFGDMRLRPTASVTFDPVAICFVQNVPTNLIFVYALPSIA